MLSIYTHLNFTVNPDCLVTSIKLDSCKHRNPGSAFILGLFHFLHLVFALETNWGNLSSLFFPCLSAETVMYVSVTPRLMYFNLFFNLAYFSRSRLHYLRASQTEFIPYMIHINMGIYLYIHTWAQITICSLQCI